MCDEAQPAPEWDNHSDTVEVIVGGGLLGAGLFLALCLMLLATAAHLAQVAHRPVHDRATCSLRAGRDAEQLSEQGRLDTRRAGGSLPVRSMRRYGVGGMTMADAQAAVQSELDE